MTKEDEAMMKCHWKVVGGIKRGCFNDNQLELDHKIVQVNIIMSKGTPNIIIITKMQMAFKFEPKKFHILQSSLIAMFLQILKTIKG